MVKLVSITEPLDKHIIPLIDAQNYNEYQKTEVIRIVKCYCDEFWKNLPRCNTHSILNDEDYEHYGARAEIADCTTAPLKDFDTIIVLKNGSAFRARFCESKVNRPEARLICGLVRPSYWFDCYLYEPGNNAPFSAILFSVIDGELYANHIYYLGNKIINGPKAKKHQPRINAAPENNAVAIEILHECYNAWVLTQWLRIERPTIETVKKPKKSHSKKPDTGRERSKYIRTEYNDRYVRVEPDNPKLAGRIAIVDGKPVRGYQRRTETWIRHAHLRRLPNGTTTTVKAALCGKKTPQACALFEEYLENPEAFEKRIAAGSDVTYRCHHRSSKKK